MVPYADADVYVGVDAGNCPASALWPESPARVLSALAPPAGESVAPLWEARRPLSALRPHLPGTSLLEGSVSKTQ